MCSRTGEDIGKSSITVSQIYVRDWTCVHARLPHDPHCPQQLNESRSPSRSRQQDKLLAYGSSRRVCCQRWVRALSSPGSRGNARSLIWVTACSSNDVKLNVSEYGPAPALHTEQQAGESMHLLSSQISSSGRKYNFITLVTKWYT